MGSNNFNSNHGLGELGTKAVKLERNFVRGSLQQNESAKFNSASCEESKPLVRHGTEKSMPTSLNASTSGANVVDQGRSPFDDSSLCSTSSISPAPVCRQFWRAGSYNDRLSSKPTSQSGTGHLHIHPKFLHSNATSHKWAFGAVAELVDNSVDEVHNGATFVVIDKITNPRDGTPALLIQDDGGGMTPEAMRFCLSFGFSDKKSKTAIGQYGNGFKTSTMRLGADVIVFSRSMRDRKLTQSIGLLSYTFLMQTRQDRILVPMVDYEFDVQSGRWVALHNEERHNNNLSTLLQWSPVSTAAELLKQCDCIGHHGTRMIVYNLWYNDEGKLELDFESDPKDICISKSSNKAKASVRKDQSERHLASRIRYSLRAYLSILYLQIPENFCIILRGQVVEYHSIANDLKYPEFILYKPQNVEGSVLTTIGFLKEAPNVSIHGFNVYHKNRLILPFWHVVTYSDSRGRGVVGVLEANFMEPTHNKQDFEKTPIFQKLETRLKEMTQEYWDYHCGLLGYMVKKKPLPTNTSYTHHPSAVASKENGIYQPVVLAKASSAVSASSNKVTEKSGISASTLQQHSHGAPLPLKRKGLPDIVGPERVKRMEVMVSAPDNACNGIVPHGTHLEKQMQDSQTNSIIQENRRLRNECQEFERIDEELNLKINSLMEEVKEAQRNHARLLLESKLLERVKQ